MDLFLDCLDGISYLFPVVDCFCCVCGDVLFDYFCRFVWEVLFNDVVYFVCDECIVVVYVGVPLWLLDLRYGIGYLLHFVVVL